MVWKQFREYAVYETSVKLAFVCRLPIQLLVVVQFTHLVDFLSYSLQEVLFVCSPAHQTLSERKVYQKKVSTVNHFTYLYDTFCHALDSGKEIRVVFCDVSKVEREYGIAD